MQHPNDLLTIGTRSYLLEIDPSGVGHAWRPVALADIDPDDLEVIEGEILDGKQESGRVRIVDRHYRWRRA